MAHYRIRRLPKGNYEIHRKVFFFFWVHDYDERRLKSNDRSVSFRFRYDTFEEAKRGVAGREEFDKKAKEEGGYLRGKIFYPPFPENDT